MKLKSYNILFRLLSFLSDKTNGKPFFVKYKLLLGTLILSLTSTSTACAQAKTSDNCRINHPEEKDIRITCYKVAVAMPIEQDSIKNDANKNDSTTQISPIVLPEIVEPIPTCYMGVGPMPVVDYPKDKKDDSEVEE